MQILTTNGGCSQSCSSFMALVEMRVKGEQAILRFEHAKYEPNADGADFRELVMETSVSVANQFRLGTLYRVWRDCGVERPAAESDEP